MHRSRRSEALRSFQVGSRRPGDAGCSALFDMDSSSETSQAAGVRVALPPPVLFFLVLIVSVALHRFVPVAFLPDRLEVRLTAGLVVLGLALGIGSWPMIALRRAGTSPD